jgi:threonine/homoserine/homoserine lactone efflux protein
MSLHLYFAFVAACIALALLPGPVVTLIIANGLRHGTRAALINIAGAQLGLAIVIGIVAIGLTSLMATMGYWFDWVRFAGAAYLVWLGIKLIRAPSKASNRTRRRPRPAAASSCKASWCCSVTPRCWCSSAPSFRNSWT